MANFNRVNPTGWGFKADLTSAEMNQLDIDHAKAPNADDGSSHTPADPVEIDGPGGLKTDLLTLDGDAVLEPGATMEVDGELNVEGDLTIENGGQLAVAAGGVLSSEGGINIDGGTVIVEAAALLTVRTRITLGGDNAGIRYRQDTTTLANADADITVAADTYVAQTAITASRTYTLRHTGAVVPLPGQRIRVVREDASAFSMIIEPEDGSFQTAFQPSQRGWVEFEYYGPNNWKPVGWGTAIFNGTVYGWDGVAHQTMLTLD